MKDKENIIKIRYWTEKIYKLMIKKVWIGIKTEIFYFVGFFRISNIGPHYDGYVSVHHHDTPLHI